ncbi:sodium:proton antiporter, partial [Veillonellaceae bacterium M2-8]|nr:sodium:proton antiporter [Veillonellaceae bacterium M2-8]
TTSIVMIMILRKLIKSHEDRMIYASLIIISANSGGAFSPIRDVTTIMLWNKGLITAAGVISEIFIPSLLSMVIPALVLQFMLKGDILVDVALEKGGSADSRDEFSGGERKLIFA